MKQIKHWSVDEARFKRRDPEGYKRWRLEQRINFGLGAPAKISRSEVKRDWKKLKLDQPEKNYLKWLLWPKRS